MDLSVDAFLKYLATYRPESTCDAYGVATRHLVEFVRTRKLNIRTMPGLLLGFTTYLLKDRGLKPASLNVMLPGATKYLEWRRAMGDNLPVFAKPEKPRTYREPPIVLQKAALEAFVHLTQATGEPFRTAALLLPFTGLRSSEMCNLRLTQVKRDPSEPKRLMFAQVQGKSKHIRDVPISDPGSAVLFKYLSGWRRGVQNSPWLFPSEKDWSKPYRGRTLRWRMDILERELGVPHHLSAHILRHTWTTALAEGGVPMHHVAQLAGHESIQTTYKHYIGRTDTKKLATEVGGVKII